MNDAMTVRGHSLRCCRTLGRPAVADVFTVHDGRAVRMQAYADPAEVGCGLLIIPGDTEA